jgi:hypothetical protein
LANGLQSTLAQRRDGPVGMSKEDIEKLPIVIWKDSMKDINNTFETYFFLVWELKPIGAQYAM